MPKDGRAAMNDYASGFANAYRARNGEREKIQDELYRLQGSARDNAKFMNDYAQYWDPASPTNQNKGIQQYMDYAKLYQTGQGNNIDAYKAYSERIKPVMQLPLDYGKLDVDRLQAQNDQAKNAQTAKYNDSQSAYNLKKLEHDIADSNAKWSNEQTQRDFMAAHPDYYAKGEPGKAKGNAVDSTKEMASWFEKDKNGVAPIDDPRFQAMLRAQGKLTPEIEAALNPPEKKKTPGLLEGLAGNAKDFLNQFVGNKPQVQAPPAAINFYRSLPAAQRAAAKQQFMQKYGIDPDKVR
jgi:hypothetical protein